MFLLLLSLTWCVSGRYLAIGQESIDYRDGSVLVRELVFFIYIYFQFYYCFKQITIRQNNLVVEGYLHALMVMMVVILTIVMMSMIMVIMVIIMIMMMKIMKIMKMMTSALILDILFIIVI